MTKVQNIDLKMTAIENTIPPERLRLNYNTSVETLWNLFNECLKAGNFPHNLKLANIRRRREIP